ncbi:MAG: DNA-binding protein [Nitrospirae bacterium]|nr:DNA-binding protein [Nitrospirota bacterium]
MSGKIAVSTQIMIIMIMVMVTTASAQPLRGWKGSGGWGGGSQYQKMYDVKTVGVVTGTIESVETFMPVRGMSIGVLLILKTEDGMIAVHLGPVWYIERQDIRFDKGDTVEARGSKLMFDSKPAIIAAEVKKNEDVLRLRDENGVPHWAGSEIAGQAH